MLRKKEEDGMARILLFVCSGALCVIFSREPYVGAIRESSVRELFAGEQKTQSSKESALFYLLQLR